MDIRDLTAEMDRLVAAKGWYAPESPRQQTLRNLAISLSVAAAAVLEHLQWQETLSDPQAFAGELADVGLYLLQLAHIAGIDLETAILEKVRQNYGRTWE
jgi:NTP pyrophosphatase (non-canonical NTP hydrolase)